MGRIARSLAAGVSGFALLAGGSWAKDFPLPPGTYGPGGTTYSTVAPPPITAAERDAIKSPTPGTMIFDRIADLLEYFNGSSWVSVLGSNNLTFVDPTNSQWAGGADPTGVKDSSPAIAAALSVPAMGATIPNGGGGTGYFIGDIVTPSQSNVALQCTTYPTFRVSTLGAGNSIATVTPLGAGFCANTTAVPNPPSSSPTPTYFSTTGGSGTGATLNIAWAARNAKIQFPCGTFLFNESIGAIHNNTEIAGSGDCTVLKASSTLANELNWEGNFGSAGQPPNMLANSDFANGNANVRIHDLRIDTTARLGATSGGVTFVQITNAKVDHVHFIGPVYDGHTNAGAIYVLQSNKFWADKNTIEGFTGAIGIWQGSTNWWVTDNYMDGQGGGLNALGINGIGSSQVYPSISNNSSEGYILHNVAKNYASLAFNLFGLCVNKFALCGQMNNIIIDGNVIQNISNFEGIGVGGGNNIKVTNNTISNVAAQCIIAQTSLPADTTNNLQISNNVCTNANTGGGAGNDGIDVVGTNLIFNNVDIENNQVLGGGYRYAVGVLSGNNQAALSATVATTSGVNAVGDILTAVGGTIVSGITATTLKVTAVDGSGNITAAVPFYPGSYSAIPSNPVTVTSSGAGTGITLNITWKPLGVTNLTYAPGIMDVGTTGIDSINGTYNSAVVWGQKTFTSKSTFSFSPIAVSIANPNQTSYSQMNFVSAGGTHNYQLGVGNSSETTFGVAQCEYLQDQSGDIVLWRVCPDHNLVIRPTVGVAAMATLDVNGTSRVAPGTFAAAGLCDAAHEGKTAAIKDSTTVTWGDIITGSGTNHIKGYCDGTNWTVDGK